MAAGRYDFTGNAIIERGVDSDRLFTWYTDSTKTTAVDITGYTAEFQIRRKENSQKILELTTAGGGITLGGVAGTVTLHFTDTNTSAMPRFTTAEYSLELTNGSGEITRLLRGIAATDQEITT